MLADREDVLDRARTRLAGQGMADRIQLVPGDLFDGVPEGAQVYVLSSVLHSYSDDQVVDLLAAVRDAMEPAGQNAELWIVEGMLPRLAGGPSPWYSTDMRMRALFAGQGVRTSEVLRRLVQDADLSFRTVRPLPCRQALMIASLAEL
ncbi:methyltransferase [Nonomuraea sp. NPDC046802]|uniref:methyltransferase n=1 Tax=Nonomuraea sp. NPDC046802 TaxID=3154919 RepID=UPI0033EDAB96